ncbi:hypothetical protein HU200_043757 [Digitaria exilis]|uniref:Uncharacterized protein n=1 Tax=Digitaria exilis TaxID=1010633 RepID=A0A835AZU3_9POAL|nr:hypothetical protein HU200_043757 [Digitaria exilis]
MAATPAVAKIMQDRPDVAVEVLPPGTHLVPGVNPKRVRVFINDHGAVAKTPRGKSSWPELVGVLATLAATAIAHDRPDVSVEVLPPGAPIIPDHNPLRVRVFIDNNAIVTQTPVCG